jgi:BNR repeat-like domain
MVKFRSAICLCILAASALNAQRPPSTRNVVVFQESGRFGGWPANNGMWAWGNELLVGFSLAYFKNVERGHAVDPDKPSVLRFARSLDGGETWTIEKPSFLTPEGKEREPVDSPGGFDFTHPDSAVTFRMVSSRTGYSRFYYSSDRGKNWQGPYKIPEYSRTGIASRTDYIVNGKHDLTAFMTAHKVNGREGRVFAVRTTDGGKNWTFVSWIGPEPNGFSIMPSSVRLSESRILTTLRRKEGEYHWIDAWVTDDNGATWRFLNRPAASTGGSVGNPPSLIKLKDGRLSLVYGYRSAPYGVRARLSSDDGLTWSDETVLRSDAGCWDLGYVRSVQRPDGKVVAVYYYNDAPDRERYIAATIWDPGTAGVRKQPASSTGE